MAAASAPPIVDSGAAIPPISLHAGVVTNRRDEAERDRIFRRHTGCRARSIGTPGLGRRIYLGRFATARRARRSPLTSRCAAGFAGPYPADF